MVGRGHERASRILNTFCNILTWVVVKQVFIPVCIHRREHLTHAYLSLFFVAITKYPGLIICKEKRFPELMVLEVQAHGAGICLASVLHCIMGERGGNMGGRETESRCQAQFIATRCCRTSHSHGLTHSGETSINSCQGDVPFSHHSQTIKCEF